MAILMSNYPLVSVVIPCLNRAHFLVPTIESVLQQDYPYIECTVVDGGSTDGTIEILKSYGDKIKWVSEPDNGHADAINKGWKMSRGEILAWLNADDVWTVPDAASQAVAYLQTHSEVDVVYGDCGSINVDGKVVGMSYLHEWDLEYAIEHCDHCIPQPAAFIRRRILEQVGWLDTDFIIMDRDLWYRIGLIGTIEHLPVLLAHARSHPSFWHSRSNVVAANCVQIIKKFFNNPELPANFHRMKQRAISNAYLRGVDYARYGHFWSTIIFHVLRAILADPSNTRRALEYLKRYVELDAPNDARLRWLLLAFALFNAPRRTWHRVRSILNPPNPPAAKNLLGDRDIEWSWVASQMPPGPGNALDFGNGGSHLGLIATQRGFTVTAVDLGVVQWPYIHPQLRFVQGDILKLDLPLEFYDLVINCSTIEHVGLVGRYSVNDDRPDGDLEAMARLRELMKPGGVMLLTIPVGQDAVFPPMCRVYGEKRLPRLLDGFAVRTEVFWVKDDQNRWVLSDRAKALQFPAAAGSRDALQNVYALGCFVLRRL